PSSRAHSTDGMLRAQEDAFQVDRHHAPPVFQTHVRDRAGEGNSRAVDGDVQPPLGLLNQAPSLSRIDTPVEPGMPLMATARSARTPRHHPRLQALEQQGPERAATTADGGWSTHRHPPSTRDNQGMSNWPSV